MARHLGTDPRVSSVLLVDQDSKQLRRGEEIPSKAAVESKRIRLQERAQVLRAVRGYDVIANTALPEHNLPLMSLALQAGVDYLDVSATGPRRPGGRPGILEQLDLYRRFEKAGQTALLSMGLDPGMSSVMAKDAADPFDTVECVRIRSGGTVRFSRLHPAPGFVPLYAKDAFFSDILIRPTVWTSGRLVGQDLLSGEEDYTFPSPVGMQRTFLVSHEEVKTIPRFLGKPVGCVDFKYAIDPNLAGAVRSLDRLGVFQESRRIAVERHRIPFIRALGAAFPDVNSVAQYLGGTKCVAVEIDGFQSGSRCVARSYIMMPHISARRRAGTTAVYYLTSAGAAIGALELASGGLPGPGVFTAEALIPERVFGIWSRWRLPMSRGQRVAPN